MEDVKDTIRRFILDNYLPGESPAHLQDDTRLQSSGILDSLAVLELVSFVQKEFGIEISASETGVETFDRIRDIARLVNRKRLDHVGGGLSEAS